MNFWQSLPQPLFCLAPMADVTDAAFRRIIARYGKPDVMWTEFVSTDGLCSVARDKLLVDFWHTDAERPIVAQIFGSNPDHFYQTALLIQELGFDGIDINMGCPERNIEKQGGGAALIRDPALAIRIIRETQRGAGPLPVSVKTRLGYTTLMVDEWIMRLLEAQPAALTIHARTRKEMSKVPAHWDVLGAIVKRIHAAYERSAGRPLIIGNGDAESMADAREKAATYGVDGVMLGRAIFGNPWLFREGYTPSQEEKMRVMLEHTLLFDQLFSGIKNFDIMKKHYKAYVNGFDGAKELRMRLMACTTASQVVDVMQRYFEKIQ